MRPIRLRIKNLRSYREAVVEFDGLNIFAVTGNTGVGKSSLLHAMTYGLFNRANSDARNIRELVTQGQTVMSVEFTFAVDGDEFVVSRLSRKNGSDHRLTCPSRNIDANGEGAVNAEVVKALHMDADTFLHTVLLRQGMHAALLTSSPGPRNRILEDIFQLTDIEAVQRRAEREEAGAAGALRTNRQHRGTLGDDPSKDIAIATTAIVELEQRSVAAKTALKMVSELDARIAMLTREKAGDDANLVVLRQSSEITAKLRAIDDGERKLQPRFEQQRSAGAAAQIKRDAAAAQGVKLTQAKATTTDLRPVKADLEQLDRELQAIADEHRRVGEYDASAKSDSAKLEAVRAKIQSETKASKELEKTLALLKKKRTELDKRLQSFKEAATGRAQTAKEAAALTATLEKRHAEAKALGAKAEAATKMLRKAKADYDGAEKALTAARLGNQVAEISEHLHPGDNCPVCLRSLPRTFTPKQSADLKKAEKEAKVARAARETAQTEKSRIDALLESVEQQTRETSAALKVVQSELGKVDKVIAKLVPEGQDPSKVAISWAKELAATDEQVSSKAETLSKLSGGLAKLGADEATALANVQNVERERAHCGARIEKHKTSFASRCDGLPPSLRPTFDRRSVAASLAKVADAIVIAERYESEIRDATEQLAEANKALRTLEQELGKTVREPRAQLIERLRDVSRLAKCPEPPKKDEERAVWCADVATKAQTEIKRIEAATTDRQKTLDEIGSSRNTCVAELGGEPQTLVHEIALRKKDAERDLVDAQRREKGVTVVEARIGKIEAVRLGLEGLKDALRANNFRAHAAAQRQRSLLIEATKVLREMTKGRFEFAADFQILDRDSNETRSAGTLSGGEQFLASLALSLGVVEIAANAGSKIESLFLDEGFDALDTQTLQQAMMELRRRAHAGRMICVISHVSQVTEFVNETLVVRRGENGSTYDRRNGPIDDDDADVEGLVSHLTGEGL